MRRHDRHSTKSIVGHDDNFRTSVGVCQCQTSNIPTTHDVSHDGYTPQEKIHERGLGNWEKIMTHHQVCLMSVCLTYMRDKQIDIVEMNLSNVVQLMNLKGTVMYNKGIMQQVSIHL